MKILLIAPSKAEHSRRLLKILINAGHSVTFVDFSNPCPGENGKFTYVEYPRNSWFKWSTLRSAIKPILTVISLRELWKRIKPDVTHVIDIDRRAVRCTQAGIHPLVLTSFGSDINDIFEKKGHTQKQWREISLALKKADQITADTNEILDRCEQIAGCHLNTNLFYFGIDLNLFKPRTKEEKIKLRSSLGIPREYKIVLSPRRITEKMQQEEILRAFAEVIQEGKIKAVLLLRRFGGYQLDYENGITELSEELGISSSVQWVEEMDYQDIPILYNLADVIINYPKQDGLPVTLFEASACMTPVITSNLSAYKEFLEGGCFIQVSVGERAGLVNAIKQVLSQQGYTTQQLQDNYDLVRMIADQQKTLMNLERIYSIAKANN